MALSSFQKDTITKQELTAQAVNIATEIERMRARWEFWVEYVALINATDAQDLGYVTAEIQKLDELRDAVGRVLLAINNESVLDEFKRILVV